ncbi:MAG: TonB-dependent receptor [Alistipes sp.]|jgi:TonB-linked SusC/RagA family outer membrane protein|nr:TonB-dependent receptor [Alistipes sp.]
MLLAVLFGGISAFAQSGRTVRGTVTGPDNAPIVGAIVVVKDAPTTGAITDTEGRFSLNVPAANQVLYVSYMGMVPQDVEVTGRTDVAIVMQIDATNIEEVIVVGFGQQRKASVVGAITQTTGEVLERAGGVTNLGAALTGNLPGVVTMQSTGMPGEEDPRIIIRGRSSWNNSEPLVLVDGIERPMRDVDINSVQTLSVLKDASATAVYGVRGANGVILITTKRGKLGRPNIDIGINSTMKVRSDIPDIYDSYDALMVRNRSVESELGVNPNAWQYITPMEEISKYRNQSGEDKMGNLISERYPNVDWEDWLLRDFAMSWNANVGISGGNDFVKYFSNVDYAREGDLFRRFDSGFHYSDKLGYGFDRLNVRSNLDFSLTKSTTFRVNLSGTHGKRTTPADKRYENTMWDALYTTAPDAFLPIYSNGMWGHYRPTPDASVNSVMSLATTGIEYITTDRLNTDFILEQDLGMLVKGLKIQGQLSYDNSYRENERGVNNLYQNTIISKWIDPKTGVVFTDSQPDANNGFDGQTTYNWESRAGSVDNGQLYRRVYYSGRISYANVFGKHTVGAMADVSREESGRGSQIPNYRENWVFRTTYDFGGRYFVEYNGAYNGSEKFASQNRFAFFQSGALGWMITEEPYIKKLNLGWLDMLKVRASYGQIGDDQVRGRWLYQDTWEPRTNNFAHSITNGPSPSRSPYQTYYQSVVGNPNVHWEVVTKTNIGADFTLFKGLLTGTAEFFNDKRTNILLEGSGRAVPPYYGTNAPTANLGEVHTSGFELEMRVNKQFGPDLRLWGNLVYTHAKDEVINKDDPQFLPDYQKAAGKPNDQPYSYISHGYYTNYDELYGSTAHSQLDDVRTPGNYVILDYDANGIIDNYDSVPWGYSGTPQNTFNATVGVDWRGWSAFLQFYGVNNVSRRVPFNSLGGVRNTVYNEGEYWSKDHPDSGKPLPRQSIIASPYTDGLRHMYDGSYVRLKNAEVSYTFSSQNWVQKLGIGSLKIYLNGNNLWLWTRMPDDRESNYNSSGVESNTAYPTVKRFNLGIKLTL